MCWTISPLLFLHCCSYRLLCRQHLHSSNNNGIENGKQLKNSAFIKTDFVQMHKGCLYSWYALHLIARDSHRKSRRPSLSLKQPSPIHQDTAIVCAQLFGINTHRVLNVVCYFSVVVVFALAQSFILIEQ